MRCELWSRAGFVLALTLLGCFTGVSALAGDPPSLAEMSVTADGIVWQPAAIHHAGVSLRVKGPDGHAWVYQFGPDDPVFFTAYDDQGGLRPDGQYIYEIRFTPAGTLRGRGPDEGGAPGFVGADAMLDEPALSTFRDLVQSGAFRIDHGFPVAMDLLEDGGLKAQVVPDDQIVQGSLCVGFDCVNNEAFGFDTIRLKENNTRIKFEDTSVGSFPSTDWQLTANDSASGGANRFSIEDVTGSKVPFTVTGGAPSNSLFISSNGKVGFRTATPILDAHFVTGDTPAIRFEQTSAYGYAPQTWDLAGNESNFFIRDVTGGSRLPFRIQPGAPTSSLFISAEGNVGFGTAGPGSSLHLKKPGALLRVENSDPTPGSRNLLELLNNGPALLTLKDSSEVDTWSVGSVEGRFVVANIVSNPGDAAGMYFSANGELLIRNGFAGRQLFLDSNGNLKIRGTYQQLCDVGAKRDFIPVDAGEILDRLAGLPITTWLYRDDPDAVRHIGPTAQDFHRVFKLDGDDTHIPLIDAAGVSLAAAKGLYGLVRAQEAEIQDLKRQNSELAERLRIIEEAVSALQSQK